MTFFVTAGVSSDVALLKPSASLPIGQAVRPVRQQGFTLIELMIALVVLLIGLMGLLGMVTLAIRSSAQSRHATEAAVIAEHMLEDLRTRPIAAGTVGPETVNEQGVADAGGVFTRTATISPVALEDGAGNALGNYQHIQVVVSWREGTESEDREVVLHTERIP